MDAARDKWQNICTTVEHQTVAMNKKPHPRLVARNIEKLDGWGVELREAFERVELVLSKAITRGVCKEQDEERLQYMKEKYANYSGQYKELLLVLDEATDIQIQAEPQTQPQEPAPVDPGCRTCTSDRDPLDPRYFKARSTPEPYDIATGYDGWVAWKVSWGVFKTLSGIASMTEGSGGPEERAARRQKRAELEWSFFYTAMKQSWRQLIPILPRELRDQQRTADCIKKIDDHLDSQTSHRLARRDFGRHLQRDGEPFDDWLADLMNMAAKCKFINDCPTCPPMLDARISEQITTGVHDPELAAKLLELPENATLDDIKQKARMYEMSKNAKSTWTRTTASNNRVAAGKGAPPRTHTPGQGRPNNSKSQRNCTRCKGGSSSHTGGRCPAAGLTCFGCGKPGHEVAVCRSKNRGNNTKSSGTAPTQAQAVDLSPLDEEPSREGDPTDQAKAHTMAAYYVAHTTRGIPTPERLQHVGVQIQPTSKPADTPLSIQALPDTGSNVDILPASKLSQMGITRRDLAGWRNPPPAPQTAAGAAQWSMWGTIEARIARNNQATNRHIYVIDGANVPILSKATCVGLGLIPEGWPNERRTYAQAVAGRD